MNIQAVKPELHTLTLSHLFHVSAKRLFDAWTNPALVAQWFGPSGFTLPNAEIDLVVGGAYYFSLQPPEGDPIVHQGTYTLINRPTRLAFTWLLENQSCEGAEDLYCETLVTLDFVEKGSKTELIVTHEGLPTKQSAESHNFGWSSSLECLEEALA